MPVEAIPKTQVLRRLAAENPWWQEPFALAKTYGRWSPRAYLEIFFPLVHSRAVRRAVVLMGARRVGKTVLLHHTIQRLIGEGFPPRRICYVSIDHPLYNGRSLEDILELFEEATGSPLSTTECFLFLDEIQYLKDWEIHLKSLVDSYAAVKCIASGSAGAALRRKSNESGAGRFTDFFLPPLTFYEYLAVSGRSGLVEVHGDSPLPSFVTHDIGELNRSLLHYLNFGGFPEVVLSPDIQKDPGRFVKSDILDKVLLRDLPNLYGIQDIQELNSLFTTLAFNTAQEVSLESLSQNSGVAKATIRRYIEYLEAAFLLRVVHRIDRSARHFKRAYTFKIYLTNPSIRGALFSPISEDDPAAGSLVETAILSQWFHWPNFLFYARWPKGEIDIVHLGSDQKVEWATEVKWSDRLRPEELREIIDFCHHNNLREIRITTRTTENKRIERSVAIDYIPAALYCFEIGYRLIHFSRVLDDAPSSRSR
ncbi:MAG TPA: ATP-binding protein [Thermoanaerobaculia bacterium]|nr:ATP-binding protein [Thermoanaerobaculia bacterium]